MSDAGGALHIIDDFLTQPQALRALALDASYATYADLPHFPGRNSTSTFPITGMDERIASIVGHPLTPNPGSAHSKFRVCLAGEVGKSGVHIDNCHWTGVLGLSLDEHVEGGTDFFRHRPSNTLRAPVYPEDWSAWGHRDPQRLWSEVINRDTNDRSKWELVLRAPMKFNRLVLFEPWAWHDAGPGFGDRIENARLIYLLSYNRV